MKILFAAAIALSLVTGAAAIAHADDRNHDRRESHEHDRRDDRRDDHKDHRHGRNDRDYWRHWDQRDYRAGYAQGRSDQRRYDRGRYIRPSGYYQRYWRYGDRLPASFYARRYVVDNYRIYGLRVPPRGYHWVRVDNDVLLTAITTGVVVSVVNGLFH